MLNVKRQLMQLRRWTFVLRSFPIHSVQSVQQMRCMVICRSDCGNTPEVVSAAVVVKSVVNKGSRHKDKDPEKGLAVCPGGILGNKDPDKDFLFILKESFGTRTWTRTSCLSCDRNR